MGGVGKDDLPALMAVAKGDRSQENLEIAADSWSRHEWSFVDVANLADPGFRDLCLKKLILTGNVRSRQEMIDLISNERIRQQMIDLPPPGSDDEHPSFGPGA